MKTLEDDQYGNETAIKQYAPPPRGTQRHPSITWRDQQGHRTFLLQRRALIGSAPSADIIVADPAVSRIHAELDPKEDGVWVRDLGSRNGTFIGGVLVKEARVPPRLAVQVGSTDLTFDLVDRPSEAVWPTDYFGPLRGTSRVMRELFKYLSTLAPTDVSVLIRGETGTGKELVARAIHDASPRRGQPFVVVDCGAIPENLMESELFGSVSRAFTGADVAREGAIAGADGGTVFFDEIGELPLSMQPKLLRVLESREVRRLGATGVAEDRCQVRSRIPP